MPELCSVYMFPWLAYSFHFKMFLCYSTLKVPENKEKGKMSGCKHIWSLSNYLASLRLFYFPHCRPFDLISVLCTLPTDEETKQRLTQFWLSATTACVTGGPMGESSQTAGHSSASWASPGGLVLRIPADITVGSIKQPNWSWLCSV